mgnify:CR=1 FL=1
MNKIKNWVIFIVSLIAGVLGLYVMQKDDKEKLEEAKKRVDKAGDSFEAEHFSDVDRAANYLDDVLNSIDGSRKRNE